MLFIDGVGVGLDDPKINPFSHRQTFFSYFLHQDALIPVPHEGFVTAVNAQQGIPGIPQSATGQTTLLTGENAARQIQRHLPAFPNEPLRRLLKEKSIFKRLKAQGMKTAFLNAYRPLFFRLPPERQWRLSATTLAALSADLPFFGIEDIVHQRALYHDFTNLPLIAMNFDISRFTPEQAAESLVKASRPFHFSLYEFFLTDRMGHRRDMERALTLISRLHDFLEALLSLATLQDTLILLVSDHGNLEDLSTRTHTLNPAMAMAWGPGADAFLRSIHSLEDVSPAIFREAIQIVRNP